MSGPAADAKMVRADAAGFSVWRETVVLLQLAIPSSIANFSLAISFCVVLMVSRFGTDAIAGAGLGLMWVNITGRSLFVGGQFGLGALSAQARPTTGLSAPVPVIGRRRPARC